MGRIPRGSRCSAALAAAPNSGTVAAGCPPPPHTPLGHRSPPRPIRLQTGQLSEGCGQDGEKGCRSPAGLLWAGKNLLNIFNVF